MSFEPARQLADAVLLEGYVLYPYRATSKKNQFRWAFGVLAPRAWSEAGGCEAWWLEAECLVEPKAPLRLAGCVRFLQAQARRVEQAVDALGTAFLPTASLEVDGRLHLAWDEGELREAEFFADLASDASTPESVVPLEVGGAQEMELLRDVGGAVRGRVVRQRSPVAGRVVIRAEPVRAARPLVKVRVRVENVTPWSELRAKRDEVLGSSLLSTHLMLSLAGGAFVSLLNPPEWAAEAAAACRNVRTFPVLVGPAGTSELILSAPIILYDHAQLAPESPGDFFDATEIDEMLALRTSLLTDEERRQARATDARAAALLDRVEHLSPERRQHLHGALRDLRGGEMVPRADNALEGGWAPAPGTRVRLRPGRRRADAQDLLFDGCTATVERVHVDVDGRKFVAVTIDGDPAAELHRWYGRFHYYGLDEVEPLAAPEEGVA